jgi:FMN phosphatase YigB (HAD superfamily)
MKIHSAIFDWKRTLYNPENQTLIDGADEILSFFCTKNIPLFLIGKGRQEMHDEVKRLKVAKYFNEVLFMESSKKVQDFMQFMSSQNPEQTLVIGDRIQSEIKVGNSIRATTIWIKQGEFSDEIPQNNVEVPNYTVNNLKEIIDLKI